MKANIVCAQFSAELLNIEKNISVMESWVKKIMKEDSSVDMIVFPELALTGYEVEGDCYSVAERYPNGESILAMGRVAKDNNVHIVFGFVEEADKDNKKVIYNSAALINNKGEAQGVSRKVHLVEGVDTEWFTHGEEYNVFDTPFGKVGLMICWDSAFPEVARILAIKGAEIIAVPAAWEAPNDGDWDIIQSARSLDNVVYIAACNRVGTDKSLTFFGKSKIVGPLGRVISQAGKDAEYIKAEVDLEELHSLRNGYYVLLKDRRVSTYSEILNNAK